MVAKDIQPKKFQEAFSQSVHPVLNQLDTYHIYRALGVRKNAYKDGIKQALKTRDKASFKRWIDTYESTLEDKKARKKVQEFQSYILGNWDRIFDWREVVEQPPKDARCLGSMKSNQRHVTFRMKKRGMHWSAEGGEAMVKIKQGILN